MVAINIKVEHERFCIETMQRASCQLATLNKMEGDRCSVIGIIQDFLSYFTTPMVDPVP